MIVRLSKSDVRSHPLAEGGVPSPLYSLICGVAYGAKYPEGVKSVDPTKIHCSLAFYGESERGWKEKYPLHDSSAYAMVWCDRGPTIDQSLEGFDVVLDDGAITLEGEQA